MGKASGLQIAFFTFALMLLAVPASRWAVGLYAGPEQAAALLSRTLPFLVIGAVLFGFPALRAWTRSELARDIPRERRIEVATVTVLHPLVIFASVGWMVGSWWTAGGESELARHLSTWSAPEAEMAKATSIAGIAMFFLMAAILGPVLEELLFRGLLFRAWEARWGWFVSMLLTSAMFAVYHRLSVWSFVSSIVFVCVYRRTGTLRAAIVVHATGNLSLWQPFLGQYVLQRGMDDPGDLANWWLHLLAIPIVALLLPLYVLMARRPCPPASR